MYEIFEELLAKRGITTYRVAKDTGITTATFTSWKQGKYTPKLEKLQKVADYFGVSIDYLLGSPEEKSVQTEVAPNALLSNSSSTPEWANSRDKRDFKKMLEEDAPVMFDGVPIEGEARQRVMDILTGLFWETKEMNKKTYGRKKKTKSEKDDIEE